MTRKKAPAMTRQTKTPKQRAEEALGVAERKVTKLRAREKELRGELDRLGHELRDAVSIHDYAKAHPALQAPATETPTTTTIQETKTP